MFCPNLRQVLRQFQTVTTSIGRSTMTAPLSDSDAALRTLEESAADTGPQLLGLAAQIESPQKGSRRRIM